MYAMGTLFKGAKVRSREAGPLEMFMDMWKVCPRTDNGAHKDRLMRKGR